MKGDYLGHFIADGLHAIYSINIGLGIAKFELRTCFGLDILDVSFERGHCLAYHCFINSLRHGLVSLSSLIICLSTIDEW